MKQTLRQLGLYAWLAGLWLICRQPAQSQSLAMTSQIRPGVQNDSPPVAVRQLKAVLNELKSRYQVEILFEDKVIEGYTLPAKTALTNGTFESLLQRALEPFDLRYKRVKAGTYLILARKADRKTVYQTPIPEVLTPTSNAPTMFNPSVAINAEMQLVKEPEKPQEMTVRGRITDSEKGEALPGVSVSVKGQSRGTSTNASGDFQLTVSDGTSVLIFSYIGYERQEVRVGSQAIINLTMKPSQATLNEVVVVGYGTQKKRDITGAVGSVSAQEIRAVPVMGADQALQGRVAGVQVIQSNGAPGGAVQVRVRGVNSTAGGGANQPLYVVDGIPLTWSEGNNSLSVGNEGSTGGAGSNNSSPLASINPNDIESIEVLKDASATAIYGSRAANGVVLITTKTGKAGKTVVSMDAYYGVQQLRRKIPVTNGRERASYTFEHRRNAATRGNEIFDVWAVNPYLLYEGTDWQDEMFRQAPMQNYNLSVTGGTDRIQFAVSADYFNQQGIVLNTFSKRYSSRLNLDVKATERLKLGTRTALNYQTGNSIDTDEFFQSQLNGLTTASPLGLVYDSNGQFAGRPNTVTNGSMFVDGGGNAVANAMQRKRNADRYRITSNVYGEYQITRDLRFKSLFGIDYLFNELTSFNPVWQRGVDANTNQTLFASQPKTFNWLADQLLTYDRTVGRHTINAVAGFSAQQFLQKSMGATAQGSPSAALDQLGNMPIPTGVFGGETKSALVSQFVRANYAYADKYLFTGTVRRDGSSRFGSNNQYGIFPSFSLGWRISEEPFLKQSKALSDLKFRVSYGVTGNQNIGDFLYSALAGGANTVWGNTITTGVAPTRFENQDIQWERNKQFDAGLDIGLLQGRINLTLDYYDKLTDGLLGPAPLSVISGVGNAYTTNIGKVSNRGFEFALNMVPVNSGNFRWNLDLNIATNKNEVVSLGTQPFLLGASIWRTPGYINRTEAGHPIGGFHIIVENGQYQTWEQAATAPLVKLGAQPYFAPGDFIPVDQNGDKVLDDNDRVWYGSPFPDYFGGINNTLTYKALSLNVFANFQHGNLLWNQPRLNSETFEGNVWRETYDNRWLPSAPGVQTTVPVPRNNNPILPSTRFLEDASFLRVRTITLAYELPKPLLTKAKLSRVRIYASGNNLLTFTKYSGWDPEVNSFGSNVTTNGIDIGAYPIAKSIILGLNLSF
ncbi:SusC/RagA family TonB-linked outer membrane protein [Larkinella sp. GY13]|uniref:SusC/RagA family TonB-linked outer membrane protein n=1 Tax=Larkinella sp. GY13 TaxID=3453720 RepID=UPI003EE92C3E